MLIRRLQCGYEAPWNVADFTTLVRKDGGSVHAEATVKVEVGGKVYHTAASGNGPVNALDAALRKALSPKFPAIRAEGLAQRGVERRSEEHTSELQSHFNLVCRLLLA